MSILANLGAQVFRRTDDNITEFTTISYWDFGMRSGNLQAMILKKHGIFPETR
ncbi:MAG: hypothetical protein N2235_17185 [Fischerella sp.]|nr:hypothetical protein [Fischerella sp.]